MPSKKKKSLNFVSKMLPVPTGSSPQHLYQVTLVVMGNATSNPNDIASILMSACLLGSKTLKPVDGFGIEVKNLTLLNKAYREEFKGGGMICTAFKNKPVPKKDTELPFILLSE